MTLLQSAYIVVLCVGAGMLGWVVCELIIGVWHAFRRPRKPGFIEKWYGDGCPSWTWPVTTVLFGAAVALIVRFIIEALK